MVTRRRWTTTDLAEVTGERRDGDRHEIIDGELFVSTQPHINHQIVCGYIFARLLSWSGISGLGIPVLSPGVIFRSDTAVAPDVVWLSHERFARASHPDGKLHLAPELMVEVVSPGGTNSQRDRETKRRLYGREGVQEYWIVDWQDRSVQVYRRDDEQLVLATTVTQHDVLQSPLLPGFEVPVAQFFRP